MKILQLTTHFNIGGISNYILSLSDALKQKGIECVVVSAGGDLEYELRKRGIPHRTLNIRTKFEFSPKVLLSIFKLVQIIRDENIDIIHAHTRVSQVAASYASRITGVPYVTTCHGFFKKRLRVIFDTWGLKVIAISDAVKMHLEKDLGVNKDRIEVIYNGVDINRFTKDYPKEEIDLIKKSLGFKGGPIIGTIGRLSPVKGQRLLIEALKDIILRREDAEGLIVGDGPEERSLKSLTKSLGLDESIHFVHSDYDTHKFLSIMDIFVFPSVKEGLGIALLEALASGKACIASDVGGIRNIIKDGLNGILVPVGDISGIQDAILNLLANKELRNKMGQIGRELVRERFTLDNMADSIIKLYQSVRR